MRQFYEQYAFNLKPGPWYEPEAALPARAPDGHPVRIIAYYLPQYHRIPENDAWWGPGFTDWSNVAKALPRYLGHRQPCMPADLGFYDLSNPETLRRQADLVNRSGVFGLCIHDYWFSGRKLLSKPLELILNDPSIDLRFCLNWANENWTRRWDGSHDEILIAQRHDPESDVRYAEAILPALRDPRYIRINGRPLIMVYRPTLLADPVGTIKRWRAYLVEQGVGDPYLVMPQVFWQHDPRPLGMDAAAGYPPHNGGWDVPNDRNGVKLLDAEFRGCVHSYQAFANRMLQIRPSGFRFHPGVCPRWDNEARRPGRGTGFCDSKPSIYQAWLEAAFAQASAAPTPDERIVFLNAWNEWGEGAYLEPDRFFGYAYLAATRRALDRFNARSGAQHISHAPA